MGVPLTPYDDVMKGTWSINTGITWHVITISYLKEDGNLYFNGRPPYP